MSKLLVKKIIFIVCLLAFIGTSNAQLTVDAGNDKIVCVTNFGIIETYRLGGTPTVRGGTPPYRVTWSAIYNSAVGFPIYASEFLNDTTILNPIFRYGFGDARNLSKATFILKVTDANQNTSVDSVIVQFSKFGVSPAERRNTIALGDSFRISAQIVRGGIPPLTYKWSPNYNISDVNIKNPTVWPRGRTLYTATVTDSAGCISGFVDEWLIDVINSTREIYNLLKVSIYPNPLVVSSQLSIDTDNFDNKTLFICNSMGQMVYGQKLTASKIPIGQYIDNSGIYFYQIISNHQQLAVGKFIKN